MSKKFHITIYDAQNVLLEPVGFDPQTHELLKGFPERTWVNNNSGRGWKIPVTRENTKYLYAHWFDEDYTVDEQAKILLTYEKLTNIVDQKKATKRWQYLFEDKVSQFPLPSMLSPFDHQRVTVESMIGAEYFGLLMEMGTGKTKCVVDEINYYESIRSGRQRFTAIVVAPKSLLVNWKREFDKNLCDVFDRKIVILNKGLEKSVEQIVELFKDPSPLKVVCVSYDSVDTLIQNLLLLKPNYIAFDESHYIKNSEAKRWKACKRLAEVAEMRRILTGTPVSNNILDLWAQFEILRPGALGYSTFTAFKRQYCDLEQNGQFEKITGYRHVEELKENMARMSFIVRKEQCLDLPEKLYETIEVEMPDNIKAVYNQFAKEFYTLLDDGTEVSTEFVLVQMLKLQQICSGFMVGTQPDKIDPEKVNRSTFMLPNGDAKLNEMIDDIEEAVKDGKCIAWSRFKIDNQLIKIKLAERGIASGVYDSSTTQQERQEIIDKFNNDDSFRVFIGNPAAGGVGLTLLGTERVRTKTCYYYSNSFSYGQRLQSEDRCHRIGLRNPVLYKDYVYANSIEQYIAGILTQKRGLDDMVKNVGEIKEILLKGIE
jgi:SNF2 family DNA or RNA helicase